MIRHHKHVGKTYFLSGEVVGGQQSANETDVDLKYGHLGVLQERKHHIFSPKQFIEAGSLVFL